jgi:hypothetical protein
VGGDVLGGTITFSKTFQVSSLTIAGAMSGAITVHEMYDSAIAINTVDYCSNSMTGTLAIGETSTLWNADSNGHVHLGTIDIFGDMGVPSQPKKNNVAFVGCKEPGTPTVTLLQEFCVHRHKYGKVANGFCAPKPTILECTVTTDPCCGPGC